MSIVIPVAPKYVIAKSTKSTTTPMDEFLKFKGGDDARSPMPSRKRKLDHLSVEEKIQRKKLKNRVAAQTSRDRKKAKMEDMEYKIAVQDEEISELRDECSTLRKERDEIRQLYTKLERRFVDMERRLADQDKQLKEAKLDADIASRVIGSVTNCTTGSAAGIGSTVNHPKCKTEQQGSDLSTATSDSTLRGLEVCLEQIDSSQLEELANSLLRDLAAEIGDATTADGIISRAPARTKMGTTTNDATARPTGLNLDIVKVEPTIANIIKKEHDSMFYDSYDEKRLRLHDDGLSETDEDDDADSIVSAFSNDHNYNMSPVSPETCPTSDPGYESQNSPPSVFSDEIINIDEFFEWNTSADPISELFPSLV